MLEKLLMYLTIFVIAGTRQSWILGWQFLLKLLNQSEKPSLHANILKCQC